MLTTPCIPAPDAARAILSVEAEPGLLTDLDRAVAVGARWEYDSLFDDVVGLLDSRRTPLAVVYLADHDFEVDEDALAVATR